MAKLITLILLISVTFANITVKKVMGRVRVSDKGKSYLAKSGMKISDSAILKTFSNGTIILILPNKKEYKIEKNKTVSMRTVLGHKSPARLLNLLMKIKKNQELMKTPSMIAGVRGSEQGKKGQFGVQWHNRSRKKSNTDAIYKRAIKSFQNEEYESAIGDLQVYINMGGKNTAKAYHYAALACIELMEYSKALGYLAKSKDKDVQYYKAFCYYFVENYGNFLIEVQEYTKNKKANLYWNAQLLYMMYYLNNGDNVNAKKIKDDILLNCRDENIIGQL